ncbi:hypothetical protein CEXT_133041 [Caerostris extrusa]|uniref:Uncharacterized protein n=1 Tax=Caerostris extrusa TaxID=172846 RepID=A0AAV4XN99_CAEEX|nr:hypothetical protein CEXT_133041 [Caerostris extrusa]
MINVTASIIDYDKRREDFISEILRLTLFFFFLFLVCLPSSGFHQHCERFPDAESRLLTEGGCVLPETGTVPSQCLQIFTWLERCF